MTWLIGVLVAAGAWLLLDSAPTRRLRALTAPRTGTPVPPRRRLTDEDRQAEAVAVVDRAAELLRVGMPPAVVMGRLAELAADPVLARTLQRMGRSLELGDPPHDAIRRHLGDLPPSAAEVFDGMAAVWFVAETAGAPAADMLSRYGDTCREKSDAARERAVALAGPAATVRVLTWLPLLSLGLGLLIGTDLVALLGTVPGLVSLGGGVVLLLTGRMWMRTLLRRATA
ncbi:type II secretion system F family protein [Brevibacterium ihuae]|uniref:type II secretion system F family protein n=1 Tax=Brevibacterium ihuae TaxID=1631743 RepID=UPI000C758C6B|nr:type II secretion system F family protein [Brevibacterium ihuae]